ncbi:MAG: hypothetical protein RL414_625 [Actinomycetota bacterium]|jgi:uncharacterized RDD family membrane protein YckC
MSDSPLSPASLGRRFAALAIDWFACLALATFTSPQFSGGAQLMPLVLLFVEVSLLTTLTQASFGQRILRIKVLSETGNFASPLRILVRTALILLVLPAVFTSSGRGFHDIIAKTVVIDAR